MMGCGCTLLHRQVNEFSARWEAVLNEYLFACVQRNKMDSELLSCLLKFIEYFPDYLSTLSRMLLRFLWTTFVETAVYIYIPLTNRVRGPYCKLRTEFFHVDL